MKFKEVLKKHGIPDDAKGTCGIQFLQEKHVSFLAKSKFESAIKKGAGAYILVSPEMLENVKQISGNLYIECENPTQAFLEVHNTYYRETTSFTTGEHEPTVGSDCQIDTSARFGANVVLGDHVVIHPHVVIGSDVWIGDDTIVYASAAIHDRVTIGKRCIIDANASIGGDGFRILQDKDGRIHRLIHTGGVRFGDDVEFGNSSCVDRGSFSDTILEDNVKIDNLVHIGHNAHIKENVSIAASTCIGGSAVIGKNCWIGIGVTISNGLVVGDNASVLINAVVTRDVPENESVSGFYAMPHKSWISVVKDRAKRFDTKAAEAKKKDE